MSHGNLCYHFANMGAVIDALYDELVAESDASLVGARSLEPSMRLFYDLQERTFDLMLKYRFLFLDFVAVVRGRKLLARRLRLLKRRRARAFSGFADWAAKHGLLARERYVGERELMFRQYDLMSDFWLSQAEILYGGDLGRVKHLYQRVTFSVLVPHLSRKGLTECKALGLLGSNRARRASGRAPDRRPWRASGHQEGLRHAGVAHAGRDGEDRRGLAPVLFGGVLVSVEEPG